MRTAFAFLLVLALVPVYSAQASTCPTCSALANSVQAHITPVVDNNAQTLTINAYYENLTTGLRPPIGNAVLLLEVLPGTGQYKLYKIYTNSNGAVTYDFSSIYKNDPKLAGNCTHFVIVYCPFCIPTTPTCGFQACLDYARISASKAQYSDITGPGDIASIDDIPAAPGTAVLSDTSPSLNPNKYLPQVVPASYCPPPAPLSSTPALCLPLVLIFSLLSGALYVTGRNPFAGFNMGGARVGRHIKYMARGRGVSASAEAVYYAAGNATQVAKTVSAGAKEGGVGGAFKSLGKGINQDAKRTGVFLLSDIRKAGQGIGSIGSALANSKNAGQGKTGFAKLVARADSFGQHLEAGTSAKRNAFEAKVRGQGQAGGKGEAKEASSQMRPTLTAQGYQYAAVGTGHSSTAGLMYASKLPGAGGALVGVAGSLLKVGAALLLTSRLGQMLEFGRSMYGGAKDTLVEKWLINQKVAMHAATQTLLEMTRNTSYAVILNGKEAMMAVVTKDPVTGQPMLDPATGKPVMVLTFTPASKGESLGTISGGKVQVTEISIVMVKDASGAFKFASSVASVANTAGQSMGIGVIQEAGKKPQMADLETGVALKPGETKVIDGKKVDVSAIAGMTNAAIKQYDNTNSTMITLCKSVSNAARLERSDRTGSVDDRLAAVIKKDPELQKKVEAVRGELAEKALAAVGIRPEAVSTVEAPPGVPTTTNAATAAVVHLHDVFAGKDPAKPPPGADLLTNPASGVVGRLKMPDADKQTVQAALDGIVSGSSLHKLSSMKDETTRAAITGEIFNALKNSGMAPDAATAKTQQLVDKIGDSGIKSITTNFNKNADILITNMSEGIPAGVAKALANTSVSYLQASGIAPSAGTSNEAARQTVAELSGSFKDPAPLLAADPKNLELTGKAGDLLREREHLVLEEYRAKKLDAMLNSGAQSSETTGQIGFLRQDFVRFAETSLMSDARNDAAWLKAEQQNLVSQKTLQDNLVQTAQLSNWERKSDGMPVAPDAKELQRYESEEAKAKETIKSLIQADNTPGSDKSQGYAVGEGYAAAAQVAAARATELDSQTNAPGKIAYSNLAESLGRLAQAYTNEAAAAKTDPKRGVSDDVAQQFQQQYLFQVDSLPDPKLLAQYGHMPSFEMGSYEELARKVSYDHPQGVTSAEAAGILSQQAQQLYSTKDPGDEAIARNLESLSARLKDLPPGTALSSAIATIDAADQHAGTPPTQYLEAAKSRLAELQPDLKGAIALCTQRIDYFHAVGDEESAKKWETGRLGFMELERGAFDGKSLPRPDTPEGQQAYNDAYKQAVGAVVETVGTTLDPALVKSHQQRIEDAEQLKWSVAFTQEQMRNDVAAAFKEGSYYNAQVAKSTERTTGGGSGPSGETPPPSAPPKTPRPKTAPEGKTRA